MSEQEPHQQPSTGAVASFDPATDPVAISVSPAAVAHLHKSLANNAADAVRLGVSESGCNGYMYELSFAKSANPDDHRYQFDVATQSAELALTVVVAPTDLPLVQGTHIDYVTEGLNSALKFANPNAEAHCGCGESFSISAPDDV